MTLLITYKTYLTISITSIDDKRIQLYYNHLILITCKIKLVIFYTKKKNPFEKEQFAITFG